MKKAVGNTEATSSRNVGDLSCSKTNLLHCHNSLSLFDSLCVCVSPVLCVFSVIAEVITLVLLLSSLMPVLPESRQITSCLTDFTSCSDAVDADNDDTCFVTSPGETERNDAAELKIVLHVTELICDGPVDVFFEVHVSRLTSCVFRQQWYGEILFSLLLQTSPPLQLVLLGGSGHCFQMMLPQ